MFCKALRIFRLNRFLNMKVITTIIAIYFVIGLQAQSNSNGQLDNFSEFSTKTTYDLTMSDGTILKTDIYFPVLQDCLIVSMNIPPFGNVSAEVLPKGLQYIIYDSVNGQKNPNPYQLPLVFMRTPYDKNTDDGLAGMMAFLGYGFAVQDMRGRYNSEGVYLPMYSDAWSKNAYHPESKHFLDITNLSDPRNGNKHEDGYESLELLISDVYRKYDIDRDGNIDSFLVSNGSIGMTGPSALGNSQYQLAAAHQIDPLQAGLKCIMPIVATNEHYKYTAFQNGVFREALVTGWLKGQLDDLDDNIIGSDSSIDNILHSAADYNLPNKDTVGELAVDHFTSIPYKNNLTGYYPNSILRPDMDASFAPVDASGEGDSNGTFSRYTNMEVPAYHITGWWDIFVDGQIETYNQMMGNISAANQQKQKLIIGPWAHQTVTTVTTGDITYPSNVLDFIGIDFNDLDDFNINGTTPLASIMQSELLSWFRYNLNYNQQVQIGEPKILIPESNKWQNVGSGVKVRIPSQDYKISYVKFLQYLAGQTSLSVFPFQVDFSGNISNQSIDIDPIDPPIIPTSQSIAGIPKVDFTQKPNVRLYMPGPINDGVAGNDTVGNFWFATDSFPFNKNIDNTKMYLHADNTIDETVPATDEGVLSYMHHPDSAVMTVGGANMLVNVPQGGKRSQGQMNLADPLYAPYTMDRADVLSFESEALNAPLRIVGFPKVKLFAISEVDSGGPTDTDFFIRIADVYPDGKTYFVVEGCVNARAREYAKSIFDGIENPDATFSNINSGLMYEYDFQMMPIAYGFGKGHKIKVLISSSNYPRYQVNPNLPIEDGEFFRRKPGDGKTYNFNGTDMNPRKATQHIAFAPDKTTYIDFPIYTGSVTNTNIADLQPNTFDFLIYPNPANELINILTNSSDNYLVNVKNILGQTLMTKNFNKNISLDISNYPSGQYLIEIIEQNNRKISVKKLIKF